MRLAAACALALAGIDSLDAGQTFKASVDAVAVDALVTEDGRPVVGLTAGDFELRDNGVPQRIQSIAMDDVPLAIVLVLDTSGSVEGEPLDELKAATTTVAEMLSPDDRMGLLVFADRVRLAVPLTADPERVGEALRQVEARGGTALYDAAYAGLNVSRAPDERALMLVFTDGEDTSSWLDPVRTLDAARRSDVVVYGVTLRRTVPNIDAARAQAIGRSLFDQEPRMFGSHFLPVLSGDTGGGMLVAGGPDRIEATFTAIVSEFRTRYLLTYTPERVAAGGWHTLDVRVKDRGATVRARRGYAR